MAGRKGEDLGGVGGGGLARFLLPLLFLSAARLPGQEPAAVPSPEESRQGWFDVEELLAGAGRLRGRLAEAGLKGELVYIGDHFWNLRGGADTSDTGEYRGDVSLLLEFDPAALGLWRGGTFFAHLQEQHGHTVVRHVGDYQGISNIDADDFKQVSEFWYEHTFLGGRLRLKAGRQEMNEDFAFTEYGLEFVNSSAGLPPSVPIATFPDPGWGAMAAAGPWPWLTLAGGVFEGRPDGGRSLVNTLDEQYGPFLIGQGTLSYELVGRPGQLRAGGWFNGDRADRLGGGQVPETWGFYLVADQLLWREQPLAEEEQGIGLFLQYAWAPRDRSEVPDYLGGGIQWVGAIPGRDRDILGVGAFHARFSSRADFAEPYETAIEFFYRFQLTRAISLKPDLQYLVNPGGTYRDALAGGVRLEVVF